MKILMTGFQPFGGESVNPSHEAVRLMPNTVCGCEIVKMELPVEYARAAELTADAIDEVQPEIVIMTGQAGGRAGISPEAIAINFADTSAADNAGVVHTGDRIDADAVSAYFSTLPFIDIVNELRSRGVTAYLSNSAGAYVCNDLMFRVLHYLVSVGKSDDVLCGFVHVPYADEQGKTPCMSISEMARGLEICAEVCVIHYNKINFGNF